MNGMAEGRFELDSHYGDAVLVRPSPNESSPNSREFIWISLSRRCKLDKSVHSDGRSAFSELITRARKSAHLTQNELTKRIHKPQSFVAKYEGGERRIDVVEFVTVCRAIGTNPTKF
jgi:ribosome-binding protein aMBF1 (putative translation factor)